MRIWQRELKFADLEVCGQMKRDARGQAAVAGVFPVNVPGGFDVKKHARSKWLAGLD